MSVLMPLADITNKNMQSFNVKQFGMSRSAMTSLESCASNGLSPEQNLWVSPQPISPPQLLGSALEEALAPQPEAPTPVIRVYKHDPYGWKCIPDTDAQCALLLGQRAQMIATSRQQLLQRQRSATQSPPPQAPATPTLTAAQQALLASLPTTQPQVAAMAMFHAQQQQKQQLEFLTVNTMNQMGHKKNSNANLSGMKSNNNNKPSANACPIDDSDDVVPEAPPGPVVCCALVQFKCHQGEYGSTTIVERGQYIVIQGDRGIDIGVVNRVNTEGSKGYIERSGPSGAILRHATQREVDYWASELKADEAAALDFCRQRVIRHSLPMEVRHAEYQFDKKKLTFYYDASARVDFVNLLKELYREYGCRIWMEKVRNHEF